ncbi:AP2/ERF transcription factor SNZ [Trema orientale]|uniref:AP2/ERF transcription factor SNZ n=1 Tax=Trema orientale TaxID=63057 RepID=A0A2P5EI64_TREOI|nr:AP2/ERF transcription factor SNZ [Trema orientale]
MAEAPPVSPSLPDLILSMEQSILAAKQLLATTDPTHLIQIYSSLHQTHNHLSTFLSSTQLPQPLSTLPAENSLSSATTAAADVNGNEPMQVSDDVDDVEQEYSRGTVDSVEEKMRDCFIKNKRPKKRPFSPSVAALAEERRLNDDWFNGINEGFDPYATRLRALDLVYQFHG